MLRFLAWLFSFLFFCSASTVIVLAQTDEHPLRGSEVIALIAGDALPANIAHDVKVRGLSFHPEEDFFAKLNQAGADPVVISSIKQAAMTSARESQPDEKLLQQLTNVAMMMKNKMYVDAADELNKVLDVSFAAPEAGFVMAELLRQKQDFPQAAEIYAELLHEHPDFPELHTKASYILYRLGDSENALAEAKAALTLNPDDAEAHKNAGLALDSESKYDGAMAEYKEALRIKPDYAFVHLDLGILLQHQRSFDEAIAEYKKAILLDPANADTHYDLGTAYDEKNDFVNAIAAYREAKKLDPHSPAVRQNLAAALMKKTPLEAIRELKELEAEFPDFEMCHVCLGNGLAWSGDIDGSKAEYRKAEELDPTDFLPHSGTGKLLEQAKDYDGAIQEYREAERLAPSEPRPHQDLGRVLLAKNEFSEAIPELKKAEALLPSSWLIHELSGQAFAASGQTDFAAAEFKEAIELDPKQSQVRIELGALYEKRGDWPATLEQYTKAAETRREALGKLQPGEVLYQYGPDPQEEYKKVRARFDAYLASLNASGDSRKAMELQDKVKQVTAPSSIAQQLQAAEGEGGQALMQRRYDDAEKFYKRGVELAEQLPPNDEKLSEALGALANAYGVALDYSDAEVTVHRQITAIEKIHGPASPQTTNALILLAHIAALQQDFAAADSYMARALDINVKSFGENDDRTAETLRGVAGFYMNRKDWPKAETYLLRAVNADERVEGRDDSVVLIPLWGLCSLYDTWQRPEKSQPCWHRVTQIAEKEPAQNSANLGPALENEAKALRTLGRDDEAVQIEIRLAKIQPTSSHN